MGLFFLSWKVDHISIDRHIPFFCVLKISHHNRNINILWKLSAGERERKIKFWWTQRKNVYTEQSLSNTKSIFSIYFFSCCFFIWFERMKFFSFLNGINYGWCVYAYTIMHINESLFEPFVRDAYFCPNRETFTGKRIAEENWNTKWRWWDDHRGSNKKNVQETLELQS